MCLLVTFFMPSRAAMLVPAVTHIFGTKGDSGKNLDEHASIVRLSKRLGRKLRDPLTSESLGHVQDVYNFILLLSVPPQLLF